MIHAVAPRTHRRRHGDAGFSRSSKRRRRHHTRHALFTRPQRVEAVARGRLPGDRQFGPKTLQDLETDGGRRGSKRGRQRRRAGGKLQANQARCVRPSAGTCLFTLHWTLSFGEDLAA
ncbi:uncharacterized protein LOC110331236 [Mus pahari]|uniref:uncharacterized protein LOC110331236 n=1 Tax=Mus pahari TaxID=10093 RepID=UPI001114A456|nr:uncharacterized protein LOC110331236 [Mus pahari]